MEMLTNLISNPLEAVISSITGDPATAAAPVELQGNATFTEDVLRMLIYNLFQGDSRLQQQVLQDYYHTDASFSLNGDFLKLSGRDELQQLLRGSQLLASYKPEVLEISSSADKAVILLNLNVSYKLLPFTWWAPLHITTTLTLEFAPNPNPLAAAADYADLIIGHHQEMSLVDLLWWNPAWDWFNRRIWSRISGKTLAAVYHVEEPIVTKFVSYLNNEAGYFQAMLWSLEDVARAAGLEGLPSAAVKLNLIPPRTPSPTAAAVPRPAAPAAAPGSAVDSGFTEGPQTPTRDTAAAGFAGPAPTAAAAPRSILAQPERSSAAAAAVGPSGLGGPAPIAAAAGETPAPALEQRGAAAEEATTATAKQEVGDRSKIATRWDETPAPAAAAAGPEVGSVKAEAAGNITNSGAEGAAEGAAAAAEPVIEAPPAAAATAPAAQATEGTEAGTAAAVVDESTQVADPAEPVTNAPTLSYATAPAEAAEAAPPAEAAAADPAADVPKDLSAVKEAQSEPAATAADVTSLASTVQEVLQEGGDTSAGVATSATEVAGGGNGASSSAGGAAIGAKPQQAPQLAKEGSKGSSRKTKRSGSRK